VIWNNGACLNVQNALGFPDVAPGGNTQGLVMYCKGETDGALIAHSDQYRGLKYSYTRKSDDPGATIYAEPSPDYFQYVDVGGPGLRRRLRIPLGRASFRTASHGIGKRITGGAAANADRMDSAAHGRQQL
jgi:hypothetical protein